MLFTYYRRNFNQLIPHSTFNHIYENIYARHALYFNNLSLSAYNAINVYKKGKVHNKTDQPWTFLIMKMNV